MAPSVIAGLGQVFQPVAAATEMQAQGACRLGFRFCGAIVCDADAHLPLQGSWSAPGWWAGSLRPSCCQCHLHRPCQPVSKNLPFPRGAAFLYFDSWSFHVCSGALQLVLYLRQPHVGRKPRFASDDWSLSSMCNLLVHRLTVGREGGSTMVNGWPEVSLEFA